MKPSYTLLYFCTSCCLHLVTMICLIDLKSKSNRFVLLFLYSCCNFFLLGWNGALWLQNTPSGKIYTLWQTAVKSVYEAHVMQRRCVHVCPPKMLLPDNSMSIDWQVNSKWIPAILFTLATNCSRQHRRGSQWATSRRWRAWRRTFRTPYGLCVFFHHW